MRKIERSSAFRKDYRRESKGRYRQTLVDDLSLLLEDLSRDKKLATRYRDHALGGALRGCRECHVRPDLLLVYLKPDDDTLQLVRLGAHSELFG